MEDESDKASLVRTIAAVGFLDAIDTWGCLDLLEKGNVAALTHRIEQTGAGKAATIVRKALFLRLLVAIERAFDHPSPKHQDDWNTRIAFKLLENQAVFEEVAASGNQPKLEQAKGLWKNLDAGTRREQLREYRNKVALHRGQSRQAIESPNVDDLLTLARSMVDLWACLAYGSGVVADGMLHPQLETIGESVTAFWKPWQEPLS